MESNNHTYLFSLYSQALLVVGGQAPKAISSVECFDLKEQKWYKCLDTTSRRCRAGVAVVDNKVYAVGGFNGALRVKTVEIYDTQTNTWSLGPPMEIRRSTLGVAVLANKIYAVRIQKFETYSPLCDDVFSFL